MMKYEICYHDRGHSALYELNTERNPYVRTRSNAEPKGPALGGWHPGQLAVEPFAVGLLQAVEVRS